MAVDELMIHLHVHVHDIPSARVERKLDAIMGRLGLIQQQGVDTMQELDNLTAKVNEATTLDESAITLLNGLSAQIAANKADPPALQALADQLSAKSADLAAAITANTPAA